MTRTLRLATVACCCILLAGPARARAQRKLDASKHNLTTRGDVPGGTSRRKDMCKFCHTPHVNTPLVPLWDLSNTGKYYQTYESSTLVARVGQPTGSSRLCLSCHDGTIALSQTHNSRNVPKGGTIFISSRDRTNLGTDLSDDHPISFTYDSSLAARQGQLRDPSRLPVTLKLDRNKQLQCTTCHDPHTDEYGSFLTMDNTASAMCQVCHEIDGWASSSHARSTASLLTSRRDRWDNIKATTVRQAACGSCHRPHTAGGRQRLLRYEAEEDNCLTCHDGSVAAGDIAAEFRKFSAHPVHTTTGVHDPAEDPATMAEHVECGDCHNTHQSTTGRLTRAPFIKPAMKGATGVSGAGGRTVTASYEYQVCYKCHSGRRMVRTPTVDRVAINTNVAEEFDPANPSFHPVQARGRNSQVPSLLQPLKTTSQIYCTDCHGSDSTGRKTRGPHGSQYSPLLVREYVTQDETSENPVVYALCYRCHNRTSILADQSFSRHRKHIVEKRTPCSVCHDPHGVSITQTTGSTGTHLINFDRHVVVASPTAGTGPTFNDRGSLRGSCTLKCHGEDHDDRRYPN